MKLPKDQAIFEIAELLWYLFSGNSHGGYLSNYPQNLFRVKVVYFPWDVDVNPVATGAAGCSVVRKLADRAIEDPDSYKEDVVMTEETRKQIATRWGFISFLRFSSSALSH